jgi:hypothetical protein
MPPVLGGSTRRPVVDLQSGGPLETGDALGLLGQRPRVDMATELRTGGDADGDSVADLAHRWR